MKISTRLALGLTFLVVLVVGATAYQLSVVEKLQRTSTELAGVRLDASRVALGVIQGTDAVLEFSAKALLLGDEDYRAEWARAETRLSRDIESLTGLSLGGDAEEAARTRILEARAAWTETMDSFLPIPPGGETAGPPAAPGGGAGATAPATGLARALEAVDLGEPHLLALRDGADALLQANDARVSEESAAAAQAGYSARRVGWIAAAVTGLGAVGLGWVLFLAISTPLRRLTAGTRELARGNFRHRIHDRSGSELGALARDFNLMAEQLGELEELKQDFVSHVSHELKGPLAAVQETILVLLEELPGPLNERQRHLLELSEASSARLSRMISNLLEASRLEAGAARFDPAPLEMGAVIRDVMEEVSPLAAEGKLELRLVAPGTQAPPPPALLVGDGERLREVVANLVGNAVKFSPSGGAVECVLHPRQELPRELPPRYRELGTRETGPFLHLVVQDEGPGIPPEHREGVFEKFYQVKLEGRPAGKGVGLGLAISRKIVEGHGGAIWVEESPLGGAAFQVILPIEPSRWAELEGSRSGADHPPPEGASSPPTSPSNGQGTDPSGADGRTMAHA